MSETTRYKSAEGPRGLLTRRNIFQALAYVTLTACDKPRQAETDTAKDAGLQDEDVIKDAQAPSTDAVADAETDDACKMPPLDPELQQLAEGHKVKVGYHDYDGKVLYKEMTLDEITGKDSMHNGCEDGSEERLWSFIKHTKDRPKLQLEAIKRMTLSKSNLAVHIVTAEGTKEYRKKTVMVMDPPPIK